MNQSLNVFRLNFFTVAWVIVCTVIVFAVPLLLPELLRIPLWFCAIWIIMASVTMVLVGYDRIYEAAEKRSDVVAIIVIFALILPASLGILVGTVPILRRYLRH